MSLSSPFLPFNILIFHGQLIGISLWKESWEKGKEYGGKPCVEVPYFSSLQSTMIDDHETMMGDLMGTYRE